MKKQAFPMWDDISEKAEKNWKAITTECQNLNPIMIRNAFRGMVDRVQKCLNVNGLTFPNE